MFPLDSKLPRPVQSLFRIFSAPVPDEAQTRTPDRALGEKQNETLPRRPPKDLTTRGYFVNCLA